MEWRVDYELDRTTGYRQVSSNTLRRCAKCGKLLDLVLHNNQIISGDWWGQRFHVRWKGSGRYSAYNNMLVENHTKVICGELVECELFAIWSE